MGEDDVRIEAFVYSVTNFHHQTALPLMQALGVKRAVFVRGHVGRHRESVMRLKLALLRVRPSARLTTIEFDRWGPIRVWFQGLPLWRPDVGVIAFNGNWDVIAALLLRMPRTIYLLDDGGDSLEMLTKIVAPAEATPLSTRVVAAFATGLVGGPGPATKKCYLEVSRLSRDRRGVGSCRANYLHHRRQIKAVISSVLLRRHVSQGSLTFVSPREVLTSTDAFRVLQIEPEYPKLPLGDYILVVGSYAACPRCGIDRGQQRRLLIQHARHLSPDTRILYLRHPEGEPPEESALAEEFAVELCGPFHDWREFISQQGQYPMATLSYGSTLDGELFAGSRGLSDVQALKCLECSRPSQDS